jgi:hypothetical protein
MNNEPRYTPDEMFDLYFEFLKSQQERLKKRGIRTWEHEELLLRFFAYVMNKDFRRVKGVSERRKSELFGKPTDGDLFDIKG